MWNTIKQNEKCCTIMAQSQTFAFKFFSVVIVNYKIDLYKI